MIFLSFNAVAVNAEVFGDSIKVTQGEKFDVPIRIKNNPGLMGFKIKVTYPKELTVLGVKRSLLTENGFLNDSITDETYTSFDVVWSNSEDVTGDGILFFLEFKAENEGIFELKLEFSPDDTFNESWEKVVLNCEDVLVDIRKTDYDLSTHINKELLTSSTETEKPTDDKKQKYVDDVLLKIDSADILTAIQESLSKFNINDIENLSSKTKKEFVSTVEDKLLANASDIEKFSENGMSVEDAIEAIEQLDEAAKEFATQGENIESTTNDNAAERKDEKHIGENKLIICSIVLLIIAITSCLAFCHKKQNRRKKNA